VVALIGQWDTAYAQVLRGLLEEKIKEKKEKERKEYKVIPVSYLRGVDGRIPERRRIERRRRARRRRREKDRADGGDHQVDYLRRLAAELKLREANREFGADRIGASASWGTITTTS